MIYLIHFPCDVRALNQWAARRGLIKRGSIDEGFVLHKLLSESFGKGKLQPFRLFASRQRQFGEIYAYSDAGSVELQALAMSFASPELARVVRVSEMRSKPMPLDFRLGQALGFDMRIRPTKRAKRILSQSSSGNQAPFTKSREVDAYVLAVDQKHLGKSTGQEGSSANARVTRQEVYKEWLRRKLGSAALLNECRLYRFQRTQVMRGTKTLSEGPDAILHGTLTIKDSAVFGGLLRRGVGRHKAFGYGMILLRPPSVSNK